MTTNITIDPEALATIAAKAIFEGIGQEQRDLVLQQAVRSLLEVPKTPYGMVGRSPLQSAFDTAIASVAHDVVRRQIMNDPAVRAKIEEFLAGPVAKLLEEDSTLASSISHAIGRAIVDWVHEERLR